MVSTPRDADADMLIIMIVCLSPCFSNKLNGCFCSLRCPVHRADPIRWFMSQICAYQQTRMKKKSDKWVPHEAKGTRYNAKGALNTRQGKSIGAISASSYPSSGPPGGYRRSSCSG